MKVQVLFWSYFRDRVGVAQAEVDVADDARVSDLVAEVHRRWPVLEPLAPIMRVAVGLDYAGMEAPLRPGVEVSLFPPVQGG